MRTHRIVVATTLAFVSTVAFSLAAQSPPSALSPFQIATACAPPPTRIAPAPPPLHVIGAQDTVVRSVFSEHDQLVIDNGTAGGIQPGQQYFLRRAVSAAAYPMPAERRAIATEGWIRIIAANDTTAIAAIEHACGAIHGGDYLEPFEAPSLPPDAAVIDRSGEPDFGALGRVLFGDDERMIASAGDFVMIDRGSEQGVAPGARFAIYRDVHTSLVDYWRVGDAQLPLASLGEAVVVSASPNMAVVRVLEARDAVQAGDFVAPRKK